MQRRRARCLRRASSPGAGPTRGTAGWLRHRAPHGQSIGSTRASSPAPRPCKGAPARICPKARPAGRGQCLVAPARRFAPSPGSLRGASQEEALYALDARDDFVQVFPCALDLPLEALPADLVVRFVFFRQLNQGHVLLEPSHHGQFEKGLRKKLHLVTHLRADETVCSQNQHLHFVHSLVDHTRLRGDVCEPLGQDALGAAAALDLPRDAVFCVVEAGEDRVGKVLGLSLHASRGTLQEHPRIRKGRREHVVEQLHELLQLPLARQVVRLENEVLDHLVLLDELGVARVQRGEHVRRRRALKR
mmetsp:Transcript_97335/g.297361  ORF Transcript_97335/g.297361 Transcript_97335/m.297361 type:complete len:304 (+) Transcript_97335:93-1004(+)